MINITLLSLRLNKLWYVLTKPKLLRILFRYNVLVACEHKPVLDKELKCVIDVGANRGQFALAARSITNAKVYSFEPLSDAAKTFRKVFSKDPDVELYEVAIGNASGKEVIHLSAKDDSSSLLEIGDEQTKHYPGTQEVDTREITIGTLDEYIDVNEILQPAMLKIDVQGFELEVLKGCKSVLDKITYIYVECSFIELYKDQAFASEVIDFLHRTNFILCGVHNTSYDHDGRAIQADFLFEKSTVDK